MKKLLFALIAILFISVGFSQDSTATGGGTDSGLPAWFYIAGAAVLALYEVLVRYIPTLNNYSIIGVIIKAIKAVIPNNAKGGGTLPE